MDDAPETTRNARGPAVSPPPAPPAPPVDEVDTARDDALKATVETWLTDHIRGSAIARHTDSWNHLLDALPHLRAAIIKGDT